MFWVLLTTLLSLTTALQWTDSLTNNTVMTVCSASDLHLPWNFTLSPDERIEDIKWIYHAEDRSDELIAIFAANYFNPIPAFHGRVQWTGQAGIVVSQADSGTYTAVVITDDATHPLVTFSKTVYVNVVDPPTAGSGQLHVLQAPDAVFDNTTGQWTVQLMCGVLTSPGRPAVHVAWTTPDGHTVESSSEHNGTFRLLLTNPPSGGNYTCTLPPLSPATRCLPPLSPLLEGATVTVDQVKASFTLLEARQRETDARHKEIEARLEARLRETEAHHRETEARLEARQQEMEKLLTAQNARLQTELDLVKNEYQLLQNTTDALTTRLVTATPRVSFHGRLTNSFTGRETLKPFTTITNEGDAFSGRTGVFTASRNGTYFFVASAGTDGSDKYVDLYLRQDGRDVSRALTGQYSKYYAMGSVQAALYLATGQQVWLYSGRSEAYYPRDLMSFTGFLISADV